MDPAFRESVKKGFENCRTDIDSLRGSQSSFTDKVFLLEKENENLRARQREMSDELADLRAELKGVMIALDYIKSFSQQQSVQTQVPVQTEFPPVQVLPKKAKEAHSLSSAADPYEALLAFKAKANKRELLKKKIVSMISEGGMNLAELKFMFVEHFRYCSKATFYNYLKELELERAVRIERQQTKNIIFAG